MNEKTSQETQDLLVKIQVHIIQTRDLDVNDKDKKYAKDASEYIYKMFEQREEAQTKRFLEILDGLIPYSGNKNYHTCGDRVNPNIPYTEHYNHCEYCSAIDVFIRGIEQAKQKVLEGDQ